MDQDALDEAGTPPGQAGEAKVENLSDLIRLAFPEGLDEKTARLLYSALAGGEVVLRDGRRLHRSWRGTGAALVEAGAPGDYADYYLAFRPHEDPEVAPLRLRILGLPEVARIECAPRHDYEPYYPDEREDAEQESGWDLSVVFDADLIRLEGPMRRPGARSRPSDLSEPSRSSEPSEPSRPARQRGG